MGRHRKLLLLFLVLVITAAIGFVVYQRVAQPPRAVLLLPEGNFVVYVNLSPAHFFDLGKIPPQRDPEYQNFVEQTGFHFEHDLDTVAVSLTNLEDPSAADSAAVFTGHFDQIRLNNYLHKLPGGDTENYESKTIFSFMNSGHIVRACIVDASTVAVTTGQTSETMHAIIDKSAGFHLNPKGPALAESYYKNVPFGSLAWVILRAPSNLGNARLPEGMNADFLQNTVSVFSVRYTGSIRLKLEIFSTDEGNAKKVTEAASSLLVLGRSASQSLGPAGQDKDVKAVFDSLQVEQNGNRTVVSVVIPQEFVTKMASEMNR